MLNIAKLALCNRSGYFPSTRRFILRMPSETHETFLRCVHFSITTQLREISAGTGAAADFAKAIKSIGSTTLKSPNGTDGKFVWKCGPHDTDMAFRFKGARWPGVVIEVSFMQKRKDLEQLAKGYILGSSGNIHVIIGLDIEYRKSSRATMSVWR